MNSSQDNHASLLLAHFYKNLTSENNLNDISLNLKIINNLLNAGFNINQKFPDNFLAVFEPIVAGGSPLHFVYSRKFNIDIFNTLLEYGVDFTVKNVKGQTVLHEMIQDWYYDYQGTLKTKLPLFINSLLSAHIKFQKISNPSNNNGFSHFHAACIMNHTKAVGFFLENGVPVDQAVIMDSKLFPGYTAIHFAAEFSKLETTKILLDYKANALVEDARGMTPLHILIERGLELIDAIEEMDFYIEELSKELEDNEKIISLFLEKDYLSSTSLFKFYVACTLKDASWVKCFLEHVSDINHSISMNSPKWPDYTALHFAAHFNLNAVKLLFERGANILTEDANGVTPLSICFKMHGFKDVCSMLSNHSTWNNILLSDGKTKLLDLMSSMESTSGFRSFLNNNLESVNSVIPMDSSFLPGYTWLHLAIAICKPHFYGIVNECLKCGADINIKNARGQTPIHLAFRLQKYFPDLLAHLNSLPDVVDVLDEDDLSHLHIACVLKNEELVERLLSTSDINIAYKGRPLANYINTGSTPLHVAVRNTRESIVKLLVDRGADVETTDAFGMTPIHSVRWTLGNYRRRRRCGDILFARADLEESVTEFGLSHLLVAAFNDNREAVERLINLGSNIDAVMKKHLLPQTLLSCFSYFSGFTPLEITLTNHSYNAFVGLMNNGAKMSTDDFKCTELLQEGHIFDGFTDAVWSNDDVRDHVEREIGFTRLHVACHCRDVESVKKLLDQGANVTVRIHTRSKIYPGCTPLHLLVIRTHSESMEVHKKQCQQSVIPKIEMLLGEEADVTLANAEGNTPIHLSLELGKPRNWSEEEVDECTTLLMAGQHDFSINPINADGISHFHVACLIHDMEAVKKFLQHGVDVNQSISLYCEKYAQCTPLHMAFRFPLAKFSRNQTPSVVVNLLLKYGANVNAQDARGNTPLHEACRDARANIEILTILISLGADVKKENVRGETPFEMLLSSPDALTEQIKLFINHGSRFNNSNRLSDKGYIGMFIFSNAAQSPRTILKKVMLFSNEVTSDEMDRTPIHNTVAISKTTKSIKGTYSEIINFFRKKGIDIDRQDKSGKTALHYAAQFGNDDAVTALLELGADINVVDESRKSAFSYALERGLKMKEVVTFDRLFMQIRLRQLVGLKVSHLNVNLANGPDAESIGNVCERYRHCQANYERGIQMTKSMNVGLSSLTVHDFLSDEKAVATYAFMSKTKRAEIDRFFNSFDDLEFQKVIEISTLLRSQYRKAVARVSLIKEAAHSLRSFLGFSFPGLCEDILVYLSNIDLKNLIISTE